MSHSAFAGALIALLCGATYLFVQVRHRWARLSQTDKTSILTFLDIVCTSLALAAAVFSWFDLLASSANLGPGVIFSALFSTAVFIFLRVENRHANQFQRPVGIVLGEFLVLEGVGLFVLGLLSGRQQIRGIGSLIAGALVLGWIVPQFLKKREELRILERIPVSGESQQPEYAPPTRECPHPERWKMTDSMSAEVEVLAFLKQLVLTIKPEQIVETGTFIASSTLKMAEGVKANGFGKIVTCELDPQIYAKAKERIDASGLGQWIEARNESSLEMQVTGNIDLFFSDSLLANREKEIRHFLPQMSTNALVVMHDTSPHYKIAREAAFRLEQEGLISMVLFPTPRGLMVGQRRAGRQ
jgi:predicted O-methyltransferase YrrM